ncbi:hypothetical protein K2173_020017 [Erythroxylum novogranatense]|uniref:RING-type E3 ubiquitin transferase BRCA1 n=1 Tax=Erythroxylum novogranatense TaxID=1862640 RepID=A0AAV8U9P1_9ROSI|nr:hypothetical protein K2173_020017 [Erythroxylum novogranatense]
MDSPIEGMGSVVATVSGYHGSARFDLIKLISKTGANFVGAMSRSTTHLVCWKFEGRKFDLARKFNTIVVNHRWVEECIKQGRHVPEHPYTLQSGQEIGPLLLECMDNSENLNEEGRPLFENSNILGDIERKVTGMGGGDSDLGGWTDSFLLKEDSCHVARNNKTRKYNSRHKCCRKSSRQEKWSGSRECLEEIPSSGLVIREYGDSDTEFSMRPPREKRFARLVDPYADTNLRSTRGKRKITDYIGDTSLVNSSCDGRRLTKKHSGKDKLETVVLDSDEESYPNLFVNMKTDTAAPPQTINDERIIELFQSGGTSGAALNEDDNFTAEQSDEIEDTRDQNSAASGNSNSSPISVLRALERSNGATASKDPPENIQNEDLHEPIATLSTSVDISCAICWTEFSSTRGILACGHRFCYSCIQNWADHMASRRRISTCPLCKASFLSITKVEDAATSDQKIYSQTIPLASSATDVFNLVYQERQLVGTESFAGPVCIECRCTEPEDLLIHCHVCQTRSIHSYCLDPPLSPWTCVHCKDLQMLYHHNWY